MKQQAPTQRQMRMNELIRHVLADYLNTQKLRDPRLQNVILSIGEVRVSPDFSHATVFTSSINANLDNQHMETLNNASGMLRGILAKKISAKKIPQLHFVKDNALQQAEHIDKLLNSPKVKADLK